MTAQMVCQPRSSGPVAQRPFGADVEAVDHGSPSLGQDVLRPQRPIGALVSEPQQGINQRVWHEHARVQYYGERHARPPLLLFCKRRLELTKGVAAQLA